MKRFLPIAAFALLWLLPRAVHAEVIHSFDVSASLTSERRMEVTETIKYDFEESERHGIYRNIPIRYDRNGANYRLHLSDVSATIDGKKTGVSISYEDDDEVIRIGDADKYVTGPHTYTIHYVTDRAVNFFDDHSEIYWNVTGDGWTVPIEKSSFSIGLPPAILQYPATAACFTGPYGSVAAECEKSSVDRFVNFEATRVLLPGEGFTVVVGMPSGVIREPGIGEKIWMFMKDNGILASPLFVAAFMFGLWWRLGRDPFAGTVIPEYEAPEGLMPHEVAAARQFGDVSLRGLSASIIEMAVKGYLHIRFGEKKGLLHTAKTYTLVKIKESNEGLDPASKILFDGLFESGNEIATDQFKDKKLYVTAAAFKKSVKDTMGRRGYFAKTWYNAPALYLVIGFLCIWASGPLGAGIPLFTFCAFASGIIIIIFGFVMPKRTPKGAEVLRKIRGLELYLTVAEKDRLKFHNAPERTPEVFQKILPYAIALGVETQWAEQFKDINMTPPEWAEGYTPSMAYWGTSFVHDLQSMGTSSASGFSPPSSGGAGGSGFSGGGSGGGMGGGGGGSW